DDILPPLSRDNINEFVPQVLLTKSAAETLFPHENPLGKTVYNALNQPATVTGIIDNMMGTGYEGYEAVDHVAILPQLPRIYGLDYLVRTEPGKRDAVMRTAEEHLSTSNPNRVVKWVRSLEFYKRVLYLDDHNMEVFLITVTVLLLAIACLGIFGL